MQTYIYPQLSDWSALTSRPTKEAQDLQKIVLDVFGKIQTEKDQALIDFTEQFDKVRLTSLEVSIEEIEEAKALISEDLKQAIQLAALGIGDAVPDAEIAACEVKRVCVAWSDG